MVPRSDAVPVVVFAKAPLPGYAKTRLIPHLGAEGAAALQERLIARAVATALSAETGPVTLWCAPDVEHPCFREAARCSSIALAAQPGGDLGARMLAAFQAAAGPLVLIGTDCPVLSPADLREAAATLGNGTDVTIAPAEDGGYGLIAACRPFPCLFEDMPWSTERVAALTSERARRAGLRLTLMRDVWDVDTPLDVERLFRSGLLNAAGGGDPSHRYVAAMQHL